MKIPDNSDYSVNHYREVFAKTTGNAAALNKIDNSYKAEILTNEQELQLIEEDKQHKENCINIGKNVGKGIGVTIGVATTVTCAAIGTGIGALVLCIPYVNLGTGAAIGGGACIGGAVGLAASAVIGTVCTHTGALVGLVGHELSETDNRTDEMLENSDKAKELNVEHREAYLNQLKNQGKAEADKELDNFTNN